MMTFIALLNILPLFCYWFKPRFRFWINGCAWNKKIQVLRYSLFGRLICRAPISLQVRGVGEGSGSIARQFKTSFHTFKRIQWTEETGSPCCTFHRGEETAGNWSPASNFRFVSIGHRDPLPTFLTWKRRIEWTKASGQEVQSGFWLHLQRGSS